MRGSRLIKNSLLTFINTMFMMASSWIISIWVARQLGPANYGIFNLVLWLTGTATWAVGMGLIHSGTKFIAESYGKNSNSHVQSIILFILRIEFWLSLISTIILVFFASKISDYFFSPNESFYFLIAFLGLIPGIITAVLSSAIEGMQKFEYFTYSNLIISPLSFHFMLISRSRIARHRRK